MSCDDSIIFIDFESESVACPGCADESMRSKRIPKSERVRIFCDFCDILILDQQGTNSETND